MSSAFPPSFSFAPPRLSAHQREFFIDNLLVRIHCIIVMIRWTGLAPWECMRIIPSIHQAADERGGNSLKGFEKFYLMTKARIWL